MTEDTGAFAFIKNLFSGNSQTEQIGKPITTPSEQKNLPESERGNVINPASNPSSQTQAGNVNNFKVLGGSVGNVSSPVFLESGSLATPQNVINEAKAHEEAIRQQTLAYQQSQAQAYQNQFQAEVSGAISHISNFGQLSEFNQQRIIGQVANDKIGMYNANFNTDVNKFYENLVNQEIERRQTIPYFQETAKAYEKGGLFSTTTEKLPTSELSLPSSLAEKRIAEAIDFANQTFPKIDTTFTPSSQAQEFSFKNLLIDTTALRDLGSLSPNKPFQNSIIGKFIDLPSYQDLSIIAERTIALKGIFSLGVSYFESGIKNPIQFALPTNLLNQISQGVKSDVLDYGHLASTNPELFRYKLGTDIAIFYGTSALGNIAKEGAISLKESLLAKELPLTKFNAYESVLNADSTISAVSFTKGEYSGYAIAGTKNLAETTSISEVVGAFGKIDILKVNKIPFNLLENPEALNVKSIFASIQQNREFNLPTANIVLENEYFTAKLQNIDLSQYGLSLQKDLSAGVLAQYLNKEISYQPFFSSGYSISTETKTLSLGETLKGVELDKEVYAGTIKKVPFKVENDIEIMRPENIKKTPLSDTFKDFTEEAKSSTIKLTKAETINLAQIEKTISALNLPKEESLLKQLPLEKTPLNIKVSSERESNANMLKSLTFSRFDINTSMKLQEGLFPREKFRQASTNLMKEAQFERTLQTPLSREIQTERQATLLRRINAPELTNQRFNLSIPSLNAKTITINYKQFEQGIKERKSKKSRSSSYSIFYTPSFSARELGIRENVNLKKLNINPLGIRGIPK